MMFAHVEEYLTLKLCEYDVCSCWGVFNIKVVWVW
jgi:hypothetical protein